MCVLFLHRRNPTLVATVGLFYYAELQVFFKFSYVSACKLGLAHVIEMMLPLLILFCYQIIGMMPATMDCETSQQMGSETMEKLQNQVHMLEMKNEVLQTKNELLELKNNQLHEKNQNSDHRMRQLEEQLNMNAEKNHDINSCDISRAKPNLTETTRSTGQVPIPSMEKFNGKFWDIFITRFECTSDCCHWTESDKLLYLLQHLKGEAAEFVYVKSDHSERSSYQNLKYALSQRFGKPAESRSCYLSQLEDLSLSSERSLQEGLPVYCTDIRYLLRKAFPKVSVKAQSEMEVDYFTQNIEDADLRRMVGMKCPQNLQTAREIAETFVRILEEAVQQKASIANVTMSSSDKPPKESKGEQLWNCLRKLTKLVSKRRSRNSKKNRRCYKCRCVGHYVQECHN